MSANDETTGKQDPSALTREIVNAAHMQARRDLQTMTDLIEARLEAVRELHGEKFSSVAQQFRERDTRAERESRDNKVAVDAAFAAQKEAAAKQNESNTLAISKSEAATSETIAKLAELFNGSINSLTDKVDDLRERLGGLELRLSTRLERGEGVTTGSVNANDKSSRTIMAGIAALAVLISIVGIVLGVVIK